VAWRLRILFVTAEVTPFARTGGLGDVCGTLPAALAAFGHDVRVVMPLYQAVRDQQAPMTAVLTDLEVPLVFGTRRAGVWQGRLPRGADETDPKTPVVPVYFIEQDDYFARPGLYGTANGDYPDNPLRFLFFSRAALALSERLAWFPHIVHCHDWHTGLIPALLRFLPELDARVKEARTLFTIHNLAYQGVFPSWVFNATGLPNALYQSSGMEFYGGMNFMKAGIVYADRVTAVSPTYAEEICTPAGGFGLDGVLRERRQVLTGIVNGVDYETWNPATDPLLVTPYSVTDLAGKAVDKLALLRTFGLSEDVQTPVLSMVTRLVDQKGVNLVAEAMNRLLALNVRFVLVGSGETRYEQMFTDWARRVPDRIGVHVGFSDALAHQTQAGSDMLLMPSRYEPCGLTQLYALRYGTIPIVHAVGGLKDTVTPFEASSGQGTGFLFEDSTADALLGAVGSALSVYGEKATWTQLMQNAMQQEFSWGRSAARYVSLYRQLDPARQQATPLQIAFGTSGWRALVAEDFTRDRVAVVSRAIAEHLLEEQGAVPQLLIAHDTRFLGREFAETAAATCATAGVRVTVATTPLPTPVVAFEILHRRLSGAINITASHNPYRWNGVKFSPAWGGPALPETTKDIAHRANALLSEGNGEQMSHEEAQACGLWNDEEVGDVYRHALERLVDVDCIRRSGLTVAVDLLWGTAQGFLDCLLRQWGVLGPVFHHGYDPYFGGGRPEPVPECMAEMIAQLRQGGVALGVGCDCDADRFGVCDRDGTFFVPNVVLPLLADYLVTHRGMTGKIGRSVATSHLMDAVARHHGLELVETPVGFKYLGEMIARDELLLGGEESGGLSIRGHVPEKDGILACLLVVEMVARTGKSLQALLSDLFARVGPLYPLRRDVHLTASQQARLKETLGSPPTQLAEMRVERVEKMDGLKLYLHGGSWLLVRASGTEPVVRLYAEAGKVEMTDTLLEEGRRVFLG
jgi:alpha-D-glucose phosphate-specific phosphoglucomutase